MKPVERYELYLWLGMPPVSSLVRLNRVFGATTAPTHEWGAPTLRCTRTGKKPADVLQDAIADHLGWDYRTPNAK